MIIYNTFCRHDIGLSPNGKALDSDSSIVGVRVPQAQLNPRIIAREFFVNYIIKFIMEWYRRGHNEPHSKCGCPQGHVGSNPTHSVTINDLIERKAFDYDRIRKNTVFKCR